MRFVQEIQYLHTFHLLPNLSDEYFIGRKSLVNLCLPQQLLKSGCGLNCMRILSLWPQASATADSTSGIHMQTPQ